MALSLWAGVWEVSVVLCTVGVGTKRLPWWLASAERYALMEVDGAYMGSVMAVANCRWDVVPAATVEGQSCMIDGADPRLSL
jgi:hypothetical protein